MRRRVWYYQEVGGREFNKDFVVWHKVTKKFLSAVIGSITACHIIVHGQTRKTRPRTGRICKNCEKAR